jgi:opacity protein-like surface antigen
MKKLVLIVAVMAIATAARAQFSVGGTLGFNINSPSSSYMNNVTSVTTTYRAPNAIEWFVAPKVMYGLYDNFKFGVKGGIGMLRNREYDTIIFTNLNDNPQKNKIHRWQWAAGAFARFNVFTWDYFTMYVEGTLAFASTTGDSVYYIATNKRETTALPSVSQISFSVVPGVNYAFTDRFSLEATINVLGLAYSYTWIASTDPDGSERKFREHDYRMFNTNLNVPFNQGIFTLGVIYNLY